MPKSAQQEIRTARAAITEALKVSPQAAGPIAEALQALDRLERLLDDAEPGKRPTPHRGQRGQPKRYTIEGPPAREVLCEYRAEDPDKPLRCPKATYDALARVIATTAKLTKFPDIEKLMKKELGELPALYQLRVALRFWTMPEVDLVERVRARYRARNCETIVREAERTWLRNRR